MTSTGRVLFQRLVPRLAVASAVVCSVLAANAWAVDLANINMTLNAVNPADPPTVTIPVGQSTVANAGLGTQGFFLDPGAVLGEYPIRIGASATDDAAGGVLLTYVRENGREVPTSVGTEVLYSTTSTVRDGDATSVNTRGTAGGLSLVVDRAGSADPNSLVPSGAQFAADLAAAYFPYSQGWMAGTAFNTVNGGALTQFEGSPGLALGTHFLPDDLNTGKHRLVLPGVTDARRQGYLFVNHAKNEDNYALSEPADDGNGFVIVTHDNGNNGAGAERDPVSFVYIPHGTPNVTMGRIHPSSGQNLQPTAMQASGNFTITSEGFDGLSTPGRYRLSIPGQNPNSGVLLLNAGTQGRDAGGANTDNVVTYEADGNDWIILSQDLPALTGEGEFSRERIGYFNFAFIPFAAPPTAPGPIQAPAFNRTRIVGWNSQTVEETPGNGTGENYVNVLQKTSDVSVQALSENLGDIGFAVDGDFLVTADGVLFATLTQGLRNNAGTGGQTGYGVIGTGLFEPEWIVFTNTADPGPNAEMNINFASVFFGADSGFNPVAGAGTSGGNLEVAFEGVDPFTDGVLMANSYGNEDNYVLVSPRTDGQGWDLENHDQDTSLQEVGISYVYLPYASQNLVAGRVDEDGEILSSTDLAGFTLTKEGAGTYRLSIPGKSPSTGMLMLNGTGLTGSVDNTVVYEASGNDFLILGLDMISTAESNLGEIVTLEDTEFSFAYIDFENPPIAPGGDPGDFDGDSDVDGADFLAWQRGFGSEFDANDFSDWKMNFGSTPAAGSSASVPEPAGVFLLLSGVVPAGRLARRRLSHLRPSETIEG